MSVTARLVIKNYVCVYVCVCVCVPQRTRFLKYTLAYASGFEPCVPVVSSPRTKLVERKMMFSDRKKKGFVPDRFVCK